MKKIYIALSLFFIGYYSNAQLTLTQAANEPVIGDSWNVQEYDSTSAVPKTTGTGVVWNFNSLAINSNTSVTSFTNVASAPYGTAFPLANIAGVRGVSKADFYKSSTNKLEFAGFLDNSQVVFNPPVAWYNWPISYGSATSGTLSATETNGTNTANWAGVANFLASGTGTVILPGGAVFNNCLQLRRVVDINITGSNTSQYHIVQYEFFTAARKLPILKIEYFAATTGTNVSKDFHLLVDKSAQTVGVNELSNSQKEITVFPIPASTILYFLLPDNQNAHQVHLFDINGRIVFSSSNINSVDVNAFAKGVYVLKVVSKEAVYQKQVIIQN